MPDDVQPTDAPEAPGQGEAGISGLYDLTSVPDELRPQIEPHLKAIDASVTRKFQDYSEKLKGWEPYEELGLSDYEPDQVRQLLAFAELAQDPERFGEWWRDVGQRMELFEAKGDDDDLDDEDADDSKRFEQLLEERLKPLEEALTSSKQEQLVVQAQAHIAETLDALKAEHGDDLDTDAILQLAHAYAEEDPDHAIERGFEDYRRVVSASGAKLFAEKAAQPAPAEGPGQAATTPAKITTFEEAKQAARERLAQQAAASV